MATLNDYLKECEIFPYSNENYLLIKEAAEINVASKYLENQDYMAEHVELTNAQAEGYMMESAGEDTRENLKDSLKKKKQQFIDRAKKLYTKIVNAFKAFISTITKRFSDIKTKVTNVKENIGKVKFTPEQLAEIDTLVTHAIQKSGIPISEKQREGFRKLPKSVISITSETVKNRLAAVLVNRNIDLVISKDKFGSALTFTQLTLFFIALDSKEFLAGHKKAFAGVMKKLEGFKSKNLTNGISTNVTVEEMNDNLAALEKTQKDIEQCVMATEDASGSYEVGEVDQLFTEAQKVCADSIALYTRVYQYQKIVIDGLDNIIKKAAKLAPPAEPSADNAD